MLKSFLFVGCGGFIGAVFRFGANIFVQNHIKLHFPLAVLFVNVSGSFLAGMFLSLPSLSESAHVRQFFFIGFLGAFTTFSAFSVDTLVLLKSDERLAALMNVLLNLSLSVLACAAGYYIFGILAGNHGGK